MHQKRTPFFAAMAGLLAVNLACAQEMHSAADADESRATIMRHAVALQVLANDDLQPKAVTVDADGTRHVRVERTYQGFPVIGGDMVIHTRGDELLGASRTFTSTRRPDMKPQISSWEAEAKAREHFDGPVESVQFYGLVVFAHDAEPRLAHELRIRGNLREDGRANMRYFVDAIDGRVLGYWNLFQTVAAPGKANTLLSGAQTVTADHAGGSYVLVDPTRGGNAVLDSGGLPDTELEKARAVISADNVWGNGSLTHPNTVAGDVAFGVAATWDYYKDVHGRNGIWNDGRGTKSYVHVLMHIGGGKFTAANAGWNGEAMEYGDGGSVFLPLVSVDITGHEMTHGIVQETAGLAYKGESGSLNESMADVFGTMVERRALGESGRANYLIGEQVDTRGAGLLRYLFKPSLDGKSPDCWTIAQKEIEMHAGSGVGNHAFYLVAEGTSIPEGFGNGTVHNLAPKDLVCNNDAALKGIGADAAARIWYRALVVYMTSNSDYARAREATVQAATDLYGDASTEVATVKRAWDAVEVR